MKKMLYRLLGSQYTRFAVLYRNILTYCISIVCPYHYDKKRYVGSFISEQEKEDQNVRDLKVDRIVYVFWTGDNDITPNRMDGIRSLEKVSGVEVRLVTASNLPDYIKEDDPLPEAYQYLSYVHRADYLRTYFMYHYGGGYADIKQHKSSWINAFDRLENSNAYAIGYPEVGFEGVANRGIEQVKLKKDLHNYWHILIGNCAYICRPYTPFVTEWYTETKKRVVYYTEQLRKNPATNPYGGNSYPIPWENILGEVFHPLCLKYHDRLMKDKVLLPSFKDYR